MKVKIFKYTIELTISIEPQWVKDAKFEIDNGSRMRSAKIIKDNTGMTLSDIIAVLDNYSDTGKFTINL